MASTVSCLLPLLAWLKSLPPEVRPIVAADADGTLWQGDVGDEAFWYALRSPGLSPAVIARLRERARALPELHRPDDRASLRVLGEAFTRAAKANALSTQDFCDLQAEALGELPVPTHEALLDVCAASHASKVHPELREFLQEAYAEGLELHVVTASLGELVVRTLQHAGLRFAAVHGAILRREGDLVRGELVRSAPTYEGKVLALQTAGQWPPAVGLGDGLWDQSFLRSCYAVGLIHPQPGLEAALAGHPRLVVLR